jgi:hypothetical protein
MIRSQQGDSIVFVSNGNVTGPAPGHREVYYYNVATGVITRATTTVAGESYDASRETDEIDTGRPLLFAFVSTGNLDRASATPTTTPKSSCA